MNRLITALLLILSATVARAETITLAVTTSFNNSGLSDVLLPRIKADTGIDVRLLIVGTGQALRLGDAGDVDAVLVHSRADEVRFVASGAATHRREIMYNDFVLVGPKTDPAHISETTSAVTALRALEAVEHPFISRGDESGTHKTEQRLWQSAGADPNSFGPWYISVGAGMGASLNTAAALDAYVLSDRASWLNFSNKRTLKLLFSGDPALFNQYAFLPINPLRHPHLNHDAVFRLETWLVSTTARDLINGYQINGETLFTFNALADQG